MRCDFCFRHCFIKEGEYGVCEGRKCKNGKIISPYYGMLSAFALDPVEKKPLYHFLPGSFTLSISEDGCNFFCPFCQNYEISRRHHTSEPVDESDVINYALKNGIPSISYTYSEPLVWQDYMISVAKKGKEKGIKNIMVSNGSFSEEALSRIIGLIDAYNIDLKGDEEFYKNVVKADMAPVINAIREIVKSRSHIEVTTLVIEGIHTESMIRNLAALLSDAGVKVWHLTKFFPHYLMKDRRETSDAYLEKMYKCAKESDIPYIYRGNIKRRDDALCPRCKSIIELRKMRGVCPHCSQDIYGIFE